MSIRDDLIETVSVARQKAVESYWATLSSCTLGEASRVAAKAVELGNAAAVDAILERFGVVELAKPSPLNEDDLCPDVDPFEFRGPRSAYWAYGGLVEIDTFRARSPIGTPEQARSEAGALLAAAKRAEAQA